MNSYAHSGSAHDHGKQDIGVQSIDVSSRYDCYDKLVNRFHFFAARHSEVRQDVVIVCHS